MRKKLGWFTGGGFEKDPFLKEEDKKYFRKERSRIEKAERREERRERKKTKNWSW